MSLSFGWWQFVVPYLRLKWRFSLSLSLSLIGSSQRTMGKKATHSSSSSIDSSKHPTLSSASSSSSLYYQQPKTKRDLSTDLRLGLTLSTSTSSLPHTLSNSSSNSRRQTSDWPPLKPLLRSSLAEKENNRQRPTFFVKVYMEGVPIGRKLDLFAHHDYDGLITTLAHMFRATILYPYIDGVHSENDHVLTYEDKEGDWMMVGDVPWEMFLTSVKRLKITGADRC
ncbi:auxin-responsive protein IAA4-like [Macadamia integrifolia]|uniref:auxin-responsive protein IAA4-like n=1 Tax=Macadamia integrifolia TaxID=60698 RepID=UPI001C4F0693|nr:auxin-responsive protein IAA4-like [Macadamia integrifolia]